MILTGRLVSSPVSGYLPSGDHSVIWNAASQISHIESGIYIYALTVNSTTIYKKMIMVE